MFCLLGGLFISLFVITLLFWIELGDYVVLLELFNSRCVSTSMV